jgi:hypothetical protein
MKTIEITGSWLNEIKMRDMSQDSFETVWKEAPLIPDANLQYFFGKLTVLLNWKCPEMIGVVAPTDSRFRKDLRFYEEGDSEEAERWKNIIEER